MYSTKTTVIVVAVFIAFVILMLSLPTEVNLSQLTFTIELDTFHHLFILNNLREIWESNIELQCWAARTDNDLGDGIWHENIILKNGARANITLPRLNDMQTLQVYCNYSGSNGCWADRLKIFSAPGHDNYFCSNERFGCTVEFGEDGSVEKRYDTLMDKTFLGYVPTKNNTKKNCLGLICLPKAWNGVIGEKSCCHNYSNKEC